MTSEHTAVDMSELPKFHDADELNLEDLRRVFKLLRKERGRSQSDVAKSCGISQRRVSDIEKLNVSIHLRPKTRDKLVEQVNAWDGPLREVLRRRLRHIREKEGLQCPKCEHKVEADDTFCRTCRAHIKTKCVCEYIVEGLPDANFCPVCGRTLLHRKAEPFWYKMMQDEPEERKRFEHIREYNDWAHRERRAKKLAE